ncbi:MAG: YlbL family protein [Acidimicrobiales bacterium]
MAIVIVAVIALNRITVPYYALLPGDALAVNGPGGLVTVKAAHLGSGDLFLTTVALQNRVTMWDRLFSFAHSDAELVKKTDLTGGASPSQFAQLSQQEMTDAELAAKVAALRRLGYKVPEHGDGALIVAVDPSSPAAGKFIPGDVVKKVDNKPVALATDAIAGIRSHRAGDVVMVEIARPGAKPPTTDVRITTVACGPTICPNDPNRPLVGVQLGTDRDHFDLPQVGLAIDAAGIGGPSAGLAFSLGVLDSLTSHHLTGGHRVAVTGTIDPEGRVGPVGGVTQKTIAVIRAKCDYFLVPSDEYSAASARAKGHHLTVVRVTTLDDALRFLVTIGGDLHGVPPTSPLPAA